jgi:hypothetical protein
MLKKIASQVLLIALLVGGLAHASLASAQQAPDPAFNPSMIVPDSAFTDVGTFGTAEGIQNFLQQKGSVLANTSPEFLAKLKEPDTLTKVGLEDPQPNLTRLRTAAELIYDAGTKFGLNPQILLVILQKEQSLITGNFSSETSLQRALDRALGFGCPDYEGCGEIFLSFYRQIFGSFDAEGNRWLGASASLMKSFNTEVGGNSTTYGRPIVRTSRVGNTITLDNTMGGYSGISQQQTVTLGNFATAALYRYTPHVFNGNYNFWKFYSMWFKYPNGTIIQRMGDTQQYVIDNGTKRPFSALVASQRKLNLSNVIVVSQIEFDSYITEKPMPPLEGTLIKGDLEPAVYIIQDSSKHGISGPVFTQRKFSFANVITIPQAEVASYSTGTSLAPVDGTLIMGETDATVYIIDAELKRPISGPVFLARKLSFAKILRLPDPEVIGIPTGPFLTPPEQTAFKSETSSQVWWYRDNLKHSVTAFVWNQRSVGSFPFLVLSEQEIMNIPTGNPLAPKDGTVFKGDMSSAIYRMDGGLKRMFTADSYQKAKYPKATVLPQAEVDQYQPGDDIQ